jgi:hypothetical protein
MSPAAPVAPKPPAALEKPQPPEEVVALGQLMTVLGQDPKYRTQILSLIRSANPNLPIPELDLTQAITEKVDARAKGLEEANATLTDRLGSLERQLARDRWAMEHGLSDEEMVEVETFAKEKKIGDPASALEYYQLGRPRRTGGPETKHSAESIKSLHKNPKAWALAEGERVLAELRRKRGA